MSRPDRCTNFRQNELYKHIQAFAKDTGKSEYINAAKTFRLPYWDWALRRTTSASQNFPEEALPGYKLDGFNLTQAAQVALSRFSFPFVGPNQPKDNNLVSLHLPNGPDCNDLALSWIITSSSP